MVGRREFLKMAGAGLALAPQAAWARDVAHLGGPAFGSYWRLSAPSDLVGRTTPLVAGIVSEVDGLFSPYRANSVLSQFNRRQSTDWQPVPERFTQVLDAGLAVARLSGGGYDPTVGPIVSKFGFGPIKGETGRYEQLGLETGAVKKAQPGLTLDLCGVAKGHALDRIAQELTSAGIFDFVLELGGEVAARGVHPLGRAWQVAIEKPGGGLAHVLELRGQSIATSSNWLQSYQVGRHPYGHVVDPHSGAMASGALGSVSVMAGNGAFADGWATALLALGAEAGVALAERENLDTLFLIPDGTQFRTVTTGRFAAQLLA